MAPGFAYRRSSLCPNQMKLICKGLMNGGRRGWRDFDTGMSGFDTGCVMIFAGGFFRRVMKNYQSLI